MARPKKISQNTASALDYGVSQHMVDQHALDVINELQKNGFEGYIVGGGIRDLLLQKRPKDFDVVTNATPEEVRKIFKRHSLIIGRRFKIVHVYFEKINFDKIVHNRPLIERHIIEISTYRSLKIHHSTLSQHGRIMSDNNYGKQSEDALRRDFTINALYYDPIKEVIVDYSNGLTDIATKTLRMIGEPEKRYIEDPVRILRLIRLSVKLNFEIEANTLKEAHATKPLLANENRGRLFEEMLKVLLSGHSKTCIDAIKKFDIPKGVFPLFDRIFFGKIADPIALNILDKTDERIKNNSDVSTIFILAGLMWHIIDKKWQNSIYDGSSPRQALENEIINLRDYAIQIGVTRNFYNAISEIWLLQFDFENPSLRRLLKISKNSRFRQGLYLYNTRNELNQVDHKLNQWWNEFLELETDEEKIAYVEKLKTICNTIVKPKPKKRKKK